MEKVDEYDPDAKLPKAGTRWIWEIDKPHARELLEVVDVFWNGEQWWVRTKRLGARIRVLGFDREPEGGYLNELGRFWQAVTPVGGPITQRVYEQKQPAVTT